MAAEVVWDLSRTIPHEGAAQGWYVLMENPVSMHIDLPVCQRLSTPVLILQS